MKKPIDLVTARMLASFVFGDTATALEDRTREGRRCRVVTVDERAAVERVLGVGPSWERALDSAIRGEEEVARAKR